VAMISAKGRDVWTDDEIPDVLPLKHHFVCTLTISFLLDSAPIKL